MITMLSDFGSKDSYVAAMKGAIAQIAPGIPTCDLTHEVLPHNILAARFNLLMAYPYFPQGTVHLAVVDPGVGSDRRAIALQSPSGFFVGPDNGLFSGVLEREPALAAVNLTNSAYWRVPSPSATFHGRDIFAPVAAHLATGVPIAEVGDRIDPASLVKPDLPTFSTDILFEGNAKVAHYAGSFQYIDGFGNLITNIPAEAIPEGPWRLILSFTKESSASQTEGKREFAGVNTYGDVPVGAIAALIGSHGWVELACNGGSAAIALQDIAAIGTPVQVICAQII
ncbi:MAG: SAM-dependent chlorinase/fluorinase [Cyanobacteria bacterium J06631_9]